MTLLTIKRNTSYTFTETIQPQGSGGYVLGANGILGWTFWLTAKYDYSDADAAAAIQKLPASWTIQVHGDSTTAGVVFCTINPADTAALPPYQVTLVFDVKAKDESGRIFSVDDGTLTVSPDVSVSAS